MATISTRASSTQKMKLEAPMPPTSQLAVRKLWTLKAFLFLRRSVVSNFSVRTRDLSRTTRGISSR